MPNEAAVIEETQGDRPAPPLPSPERVQALLFEAARGGRVDVIPALLQAGADISATDAKGYTPLILASYNGHADATCLLLDLGAAVDQRDIGRGNTALMGTAFKGYVAIADFLLQNGADPNARNEAGQTALMMAALFGQTAIVDRLLECGADPQASDVAGNNAFTLAQTQGNTSMVTRLAELTQAA